MAYDDEVYSSYNLILTAEIVTSYLGNAAHVQAPEIPSIIKSVRGALEEGSAPAAEEAAAPAPKMHGSQVKKSITRHGHDMKSYREAYGLPNDYPSVAPSYSAARSEMAKRLGLGARGKNAKADAAPAKAAAPKRGRKAAETPTSAEG